MSVQAQYKLLLDVNRDESFALELPVMSMEWNNGLSDAFATLSEVTTLQAAVANPDGALTEGIFGDFNVPDRVEERGIEALTNGDFDDWTGGEPDIWTKRLYFLTPATSETASGGGAGSGSLNVAGTGSVGYGQYLTAQRTYEITVVVSEFSASSGSLKVQIKSDPVDGSVWFDAGSIRDVGTYTYLVDVEAATYLELEFTASGMSVTVDSVSAREVLVTYDDLQPVFDLLEGGEELLTNGDFDDWTGGVPDGWTPDDTVTEVGSGEDSSGTGSGSANLSEASFGGAGVAQVVPMFGQQVYRFTVVLSYLDGADALLQAGITGAPAFNNCYAAIREAGTHTFYFTHPGKADVQYQATVEFRVVSSSLPVEATIDRVSVVPVSLLPRYIKRTGTGYKYPPAGAAILRASPFRGTLMKVVASYAELENVQLWVGKVDSVIPTPSIHDNPRTVTFVCKDPMDQFRDRDYMQKFSENVTVDQALTEMLTEHPTITYPYASSFWVLGAPGASEAGTNTVLYGGPPMNFETGVAVIPFVGDNSDRAQPSASDNRDMQKQGVSQLGFIRDLMAAEVDGRFFWDGRHSEFVFHNRHHDLNDDPVAAVIDNWVDANFIASDIVYSDVQVSYQPREVGAPQSVLWRHNALPLRIPPGKTVTVNVRYTDPDNPGVRVGAKDVLQLVPDVDLFVTFNDTGAGRNVHRRLSHHVDARGNGAIITLSNSDHSRIIWVHTLQVRGTPIRTYQVEQVTATSAEAVRDNDPQVLDYRAQLIADTDAAQDVADFLLNRYARPRRRVASVTYMAQVSDERMRNALTLSVGDVVRVPVPFVHHDGVYTIVGEQHRVEKDQGDGLLTHLVTYVLKPRNNLDFWILDDSKRSTLGVSTHLAF